MSGSDSTPNGQEADLFNIARQWRKLSEPLERKEGEMLPPSICKPCEMTDNEKEEFIALVLKGGQVAKGTLEDLVDRAEFLVRLFEHDALIGTAAVKSPYEDHRRGEFCKAGVADRADDFPLEIGWIVVHPDHQGKGYSRKLVQSAVEASRDDGVYATTRTDKIKNILPDFGFKKIGVEFESDLNKEQYISLFVKFHDNAEVATTLIVEEG